VYILAYRPTFQIQQILLQPASMKTREIRSVAELRTHFPAAEALLKGKFEFADDR